MYKKILYITALSSILSISALSVNALADNEKIYHAFSGAKIEIERDLSNTECETTTSYLMQISTSIGQMIGESIETECNKSISISLPAVKRITRFQLDTVVSKGENKTELEPVVIKAYPDNQLKALQLWSAQRIVFVDDTGGRLLEVLDKYDIGYQSRRSGILKDKGAMIQVGAGQIIFKEKTELVPMVKITPHLVTVEMPFLEGLLNDPAKQKMLADIFLELKKTKEKGSKHYEDQ